MRALLVRLLAALNPAPTSVDDSGRVLGFCFILAAIAGLFASMVKKLSLRDTLVAAGVSGVAGLVVGALCVYLWGPEKWYLTCAVCSMAGWAGGALVLDRLTFVAWTLAQGKSPAIGNPPGTQEKTHDDALEPTPPTGAVRPELPDSPSIDGVSRRRM